MLEEENLGVCWPGPHLLLPRPCGAAWPWVPQHPPLQLPSAWCPGGCSLPAPSVGAEGRPVASGLPGQQPPLPGCPASRGQQLKPDLHLQQPRSSSSMSLGQPAWRGAPAWALVHAFTSPSCEFAACSSQHGTARGALHTSHVLIYLAAQTCVMHDADIAAAWQEGSPALRNCV